MLVQGVPEPLNVSLANRSLYKSRSWTYWGKTLLETHLDVSYVSEVIVHGIHDQHLHVMCHHRGHAVVKLLKTDRKFRIREQVLPQARREYLHGLAVIRIHQRLLCLVDVSGNDVVEVRQIVRRGA